MNKPVSNQAEPSISVMSQYIRDVSFENFAPPGAFELEGTPSIKLNVDVQARDLDEPNCVAVELKIEVDGKTSSNEQLFILEVVYAGVFCIKNVPDDNMRRFIIGAHCPSLLFPFARQVVAYISHNASFQPIMIDPVDFAKLYAKSMQPTA